MIKASEITAVILAGGEGARLGGVDKGWISLDGQSLIERLLQGLAGQVERTIINTNHNHERYAALGCEVMADPPGASGGPVAGVYAVWPQLRTRYLLLLPVDAAQVPVGLLAALKKTLEDDAVAIARACRGEDIHPTCVLLDCSMVKMPDHPGGSLMGWQNRYSISHVAVSSEAQLSINTAEELTAIHGVIDQAARLSSNSSS